MQKSHIYFAIGSLLGILLVGTLAFFSYQTFTQKETTPVFDAALLFSQIDTENSLDDFLEIENLIGETMKQYGTKAGFLLIDEGEKRGVVSNDECHGLLHYIGHAAYEQHKEDYDAILAVVEGTSCLGGYLHGVEAEIILQSSNVIQEVQNFCTYQKEKHVNPGPCFHGAGHAAAELYHYDVPKSLALCDSLAGGPEDDLSNCYRGIFSEVGNVVVGYDGHTGLTVDVIEIPGLNPKKPFEYCNTIATKYQSSCKSQLMKIFFTGNMDSWLDACVDPTLDSQTRNICANIGAGVFVRSTLSSENTAILPNTVNQLNLETQKVAILGSAEAFSGYFADNNPKDWTPFCDAFKNQRAQTYCNEVFTDIITNNSAPWMERTDIR